MGYTKISYEVGRAWFWVGFGYWFLARTLLTFVPMLPKPFGFPTDVAIFIVYVLALVMTISFASLVHYRVWELSRIAKTDNKNIIVEAMDMFGYDTVKMIASQARLCEIKFQKAFEIHKRVAAQKKYWRFYSELYPVYAAWQPESLDDLFIAFAEYHLEDQPYESWTSEEHHRWYSEQLSNS